MRLDSVKPALVWLTTLLLSGQLQGEIDQTGPGAIDEKRLLNADHDRDNWLTLGGNLGQQFYSGLDDINEENVGALGFAWEYDASSRIGTISRGLEATPYVVDGIMYTSGAWGVVYALDAATGEEIWRYDPAVQAWYNRRTCCDVVNRGVAVWKGRVYVGTIDGFLACLDAETGEELWYTDTIEDRSISYAITGAPQVAGNVVVIGNSGAEYGVRGYITAYDVNTGEEVWRFYTVPGDPKKGFEHPEMEEASKTWDPNSFWEAGGGGTVWGLFNYDPELNLLYVGTGNASPYPIWFRSPEGGDNLYLCSILAINPDTGRLAWHYQTTPGEMWDYTACMNMILADLEIEGVQRKVLMQAPKNGFFYVLDRANGELISGEKFTVANWASGIDMQTGKPMVTEQAWYKDEPKFVIPTYPGGHSWMPMSYSPDSGLVYIPEIVQGMIYSSAESYEYTKLKFNTGLGHVEGAIYPYHEDSMKYVEGQPGTTPKDYLNAWDPVKQESAWRIELPTTKGNGGVLSTGGNLVFQGVNTGHLNVHNAKTGELLKSIETGTAIMAAPMTYKVDGVQYVAVMAGYGGSLLAFGSTDPKAAVNKYKNSGRIIAFRLGGDAVPLPPEVETIPVPEPPMVEIDQELFDRGQELSSYCFWCHEMGDDETRVSQYPNLAKLTKDKHAIFKQIVYHGVFKTLGMSNFDDVLSEEDVEAIQHYLISIQRDWWELQEGISNPDAEEKAPIKKMGRIGG